MQKISSLDNPLIKHLLKLKNSSDYRYAEHALLLEGIKPIRELPQGVIKKVIASDASLLQGFSCNHAYLATEGVIKKISGLVTSEGLIAEVTMPPMKPLLGYQRIIALDGINDPGNMGTVLRTALALGWHGIYILPTSCDPYNEKVIRSARGAHFKLALYRGSVNDLKALVEREKLQALVADIAGVTPEKTPISKGCLLVLGNEARGPSEEILRFCSRVTIPMTDDVESLNVGVAGGILMYLLGRNCS